MARDSLLAPLQSLSFFFFLPVWTPSSLIYMPCRMWLSIPTAYRPLCGRIHHNLPTLKKSSGVALHVWVSGSSSLAHSIASLGTGQVGRRHQLRIVFIQRLWEQRECYIRKCNHLSFLPPTQQSCAPSDRLATS